MKTNVEELAKRDIEQSVDRRAEFEASLKQKDLNFLRKLRAEYRLRKDDPDWEPDDTDRDDLSDVIQDYCDKWARESVKSGWWVEFRYPRRKDLGHLPESTHLSVRGCPKITGSGNHVTREFWFDGEEILSVTIHRIGKNNYVPAFSTPKFHAPLNSYSNTDQYHRTPEDALSGALHDALREFYCGSA